MGLRIAGAGCSLIDYLYTPVDFASSAFRSYASLRDGDGGLSPGRLVFAEELERFAGRGFAEVLADLVGGAAPSRVALGGPAVVALIHAAQMLQGGGVHVSFQGARGDDETGRRLMDFLRDAPLDVSSYRVLAGATPFTYVFSDPSHGAGRGERMFVNAIGAAGMFAPSELDERIFDADIVLFGGTGIVPPLHRALAGLLRKAKGRGAVTVVNTVFDFINEKNNPRGRWPLGESDETYGLIDLLITDREEALRMSGASSPDAAVDVFADLGVAAAVVTQGDEPVCVRSRGGLFAAAPAHRLPVCQAVVRELAEQPARRGDTTGCGDNFVGGMLASVAAQLDSGVRLGSLDLREACAWAVASGGFTCFYVGGTYQEARVGEKRSLIEPYYRAYLEQIS